MKHILPIFFTLLLTFSSHAQTSSPKDLTPYFTAIIVSNMDSSLVWYQQVLGFDVVNNKQFPEMGFKQANMTRGSASLELIELSSAINPQEVIPNYNAKTKIQGLFKFGFQVDDFDKWIEYLEEQKVPFNGGVVTDELTNKRMVIILDPDNNRIQLFEK
ncbi:MAG: VOC family protein [Reichenbachiella sp.]|uniref:VOC family protein n=1 Tax=Reichenbachiella sp. TaxID=2184521 RepID=UPI003296E293